MASYEYRCDERLKVKAEGSTRLPLHLAARRELQFSFFVSSSQVLFFPRFRAQKPVRQSTYRHLQEHPWRCLVDLATAPVAHTPHR